MQFRKIKRARLVTDGINWSVCQFRSTPNLKVDLWEPVGTVYVLRPEDSELINRWKAAYDATTQH